VWPQEAPSLQVVLRVVGVARARAIIGRSVVAAEDPARRSSGTSRLNNP